MLWSLTYEVWFSILLPVYLVAAVTVRRIPFWAAAGALLVIIMVGGQLAFTRYNFLPIFYMPMFALGTLMAFKPFSVRLGKASGVALSALCVVLLTADWWAQPQSFQGAARTLTSGLSAGLVAAGACLAVALPLTSPSVARILSAKPATWLGSRSYSLYLVQSQSSLRLRSRSAGNRR